MQRITRRPLLAAALAGLGAAAARAQEAWPGTRPVRLIVPYTPGGGSDIAARVLTEAMATLPGVPRFVIDNRPGAGGAIGCEMLAQAPADGWTLGVITIATHGINPTLYPRLPYDPVADFTPVGLMNLQPVVIAARADSRLRDLEALLATREELTFGSAGNGLSGHAAGEMLRLRSGVKLVHVPYRGSSAAWTDLLGGRVDLVIDNVATAMPHVQAGTVRLLGISSREPMPGVAAPPVASRLPGYVVDSWNVLAGPARLPAAVLARLAALMTAAFQLPSLRARYAELRMLPPTDPSPEFAARYIREQIALWAPVVREAGMRVD